MGFIAFVQIVFFKIQGTNHRILITLDISTFNSSEIACLFVETKIVISQVEHSEMHEDFGSPFPPSLF